MSDLQCTIVRQLNLWVKGSPTAQVYCNPQGWELRDGMLLIFMGGNDVHGFAVSSLSRFEYEETHHEVKP
jgi:hypothetical protein